MEEESKVLTAVSVKEVDLEEWAFEIHCKLSTASLTGSGPPCPQ